MWAANLSSASRASRHERRPKEQIFRRVPGERELRERDQVTTGGVGALVGNEHALHVAVEIAHDEVELRGSETEAGHLVRIRDTAWMPGGTTLHETPALATAIERSADARTARMLLERAVEEHAGLADELVTDPLVRDGLIALACASRSLSSAVVADDSLLEPLRDPDDFARERTVESYRTSWSAVPEHDAQALRRWKRRELLRVAVRDLLGTADMPAVGRELAALAAVCLEAALAIVDPAVRFAVIGMGKLGGRELNYASDVDVLFVHDGDADAAEHTARAVLSTMTSSNEYGIVFRTDANLRPEGRQGPLTRTLESYASYYDGWARTWEFQALLKARPVAGDRALGAEFMALTTPRVWPDRLEPDALREIRAMKERAEEITERKGLAERELKRGRGGIRDIEFAVQLLQLVHGREDASVRSPTTLDALQELAAGGYVDRPDADRLDRGVPVPPDGRAPHPALRRAADARDPVRRARAHPPGAGARVPRQPRTDRARALRSGAPGAPARGPGASTSVCSSLRSSRPSPGTGALSPEAAEERLAAFGFTDVERTRAAVRELADGLTRRSRVMREMLPVILEWLSETPDPDLGLLQLRRLVEGPARSASLAVTFRDAPGAAERACHLLGCQPGRRRGPAAAPGVRRHPRRRRDPRGREHARRARRRRLRHARVAGRPGAAS